MVNGYWLGHFGKILKTFLFIKKYQQTLSPCQGYSTGSFFYIFSYIPMYFLFPYPPPTLGYPKKDQVGIYLYQCFGSVGSVRFWLPGSGSGSSKICRSTDPDSRGKITTKNCKKKTFFTPKPQIWTFEKREIIKFSSCLNGSSSFG